MFDKVKEKIERKETTAHDAYLMAKYGEISTDEKILNNFYSRVFELIKAKTRDIGSVFGPGYSLTMEIPAEIYYKSQEILNHYDQLGYETYILENGNSIMGNFSGGEINGLIGPTLLLIWGNYINPSVETIEK